VLEQIIIGIDPGKSGGVCFMTKNGEVFLTFPMPETPPELLKELEKASFIQGISHAFIEKAQAMPKNGAVSMFNYGMGFGQILGFVAALKIPYTLVQPRTWTKLMHMGTNGDEPKKRSLEAVQRIFPTVNLLASSRCKKPHDGLVDAILIAEYGRRYLQK
jgi:hypothetical protein